MDQTAERDQAETKGRVILRGQTEPKSRAMPQGQAVPKDQATPKIRVKVITEASSRPIKITRKRKSHRIKNPDFSDILQKRKIAHFKPGG